MQRHQIGAQRHQGGQLGLEPGRVAKTRRGDAQRGQRIAAQPGPEAFIKQIGAQKGAIDIQHQRFHVRHSYPFEAKTQPSVTSSGGLRHRPRATCQAASTLGT